MVKLRLEFQLLTELHEGIPYIKVSVQSRTELYRQYLAPMCFPLIMFLQLTMARLDLEKYKGVAGKLCFPRALGLHS